MYGMIFDFLREYVVERHGGKETWKALLDDNDYGYKIYFPVKEYPDEEIVALATSASKALNLPLPDVLEDFGSFVGPKLTTFYHMYVKDKSWKTLDIIEIAGSRGVLEILCHFSKISKNRNDTCLNNSISIKPWLPCRTVKT